MDFTFCEWVSRTVCVMKNKKNKKFLISIINYNDDEIPNFNAIIQYELVCNVRLPLISILDKIVLENKTYVILEEMTLISNCIKINKTNLIRSIMKMIKFNSISKYGFEINKNKIFYKDDKFYFNPTNVTLTNVNDIYYNLYQIDDLFKYLNFSFNIKSLIESGMRWRRILHELKLWARASDS